MPTIADSQPDPKEAPTESPHPSLLLCTLRTRAAGTADQLHDAIDHLAEIQSLVGALAGNMYDDARTREQDLIALLQYVWYLDGDIRQAARSLAGIDTVAHTSDLLAALRTISGEVSRAA
jgi:hypothetical protein